MTPAHCSQLLVCMRGGGGKHGRRRVPRRAKAHVAAQQNCTAGAAGAGSRHSRNGLGGSAGVQTSRRQSARGPPTQRLCQPGGRRVTASKAVLCCLRKRGSAGCRKKPAGKECNNGLTRQPQLLALQGRRVHHTHHGAVVRRSAMLLTADVAARRRWQPVARLRRHALYCCWVLSLCCRRSVGTHRQPHADCGSAMGGPARLWAAGKCAWHSDALHRDGWLACQSAAGCSTVPEGGGRGGLVAAPMQASRQAAHLHQRRVAALYSPPPRQAATAESRVCALHRLSWRQHEPSSNFKNRTRPHLIAGGDAHIDVRTGKSRQLNSRCFGFYTAGNLSEMARNVVLRHFCRSKHQSAAADAARCVSA